VLGSTNREEIKVEERVGSADRLQGSRKGTVWTTHSGDDPS